MKNIRHQIKSSWYYIFWGIATVSVVAGQWYVGSGYREMASEIKDVSNEISKLNGRVGRALPWSN